jgi:hypothetical protein
MVYVIRRQRETYKKALTRAVEAKPHSYLLFSELKVPNAISLWNRTSKILTEAGHIKWDKANTYQLIGAYDVEELETDINLVYNSRTPR